MPGLPRATTSRLALCVAVALPALALRITGTVPGPLWSLLSYGAAVVAASFLLAWAAEAAQVDISGGLAIAVLAFIAVLPEYAVDLYFAYTAGHRAEFTQYATANMTGSNRLLLGLGWPLVTLVAVRVLRRRGPTPPPRALTLPAGSRVELGFLLIAGAAAFVVPVTAQIHLALAVALLCWFGFYLYRVGAEEVEAPDLVGTPARIGALPSRRRRPLVAGMFLTAGMVVLGAAKPFANALVDTGAQLGIDRFLLVQWLAPLASEAPEFIVAMLFALRGKGDDAIGTLISSKVNQWTLLVGSLPLAYLAGGGSGALPLDARQVEEMLLTATQTLLGVAALLSLRFPRWAAWTLLGLFLVQFALPGREARLGVSAVYAALALAAAWRHRAHLPATLAAPFRRPPVPAAVEAAQRGGNSR